MGKGMVKGGKGWEKNGKRMGKEQGKGRRRGGNSKGKERNESVKVRKTEEKDEGKPGETGKKCTAWGLIEKVVKKKK